MRKPKPINALLKRLKEIKTYAVDFSDVCDIKNACIDYMNETQNRIFEDLLNEIVEYDLVMECIRYRAEQGDLYGIQNLVEWLDNADYYRDNGDYFENIDYNDIRERLDEIIELAEDRKKNYIN